MKKRIGIIGVGSAGLLSLVHFITWLDKDWEVVSIHNPKKPILGIGESTNGGFVGLLERGAHFSLGNKEDLNRLDATLKFGSYFTGWRENSWVNPLLDGNTAIHFNNFHFKDYIYERLEKLWPDQFRSLEGDVKSVKNHPDKVTVDIDGQNHDFDFLVDCMGFPTNYDGYTMSNCTPVNRCVVHDVEDYKFEPYTDHIAHKNGWMFGVPLNTRKSYGFLYNNTIIDKPQAITEMQELLGVDDIKGREFAFECYYTNHLIEGRVLKNGNKALFFEPLVANSIFLYIHAVRLFFDYVKGGADAQTVNSNFVSSVQEMEDVISYYYKGGSNYESEFWDYAKKMTSERLAKRTAFHQLMAHYRHLKSRGVLNEGPTYGFSPLTWEIVDGAMGYASF